MRKRIILLPLLAIGVFFSWQYLNAARLNQNRTTATIEIVRLEEDKDRIIIFQAFLDAPLGTEIINNSVGADAVTDSKVEFLIVAKIYVDKDIIEPPIGNKAVIELSLYAPYLQRTSHLVVSADTVLQDIENYASFAKPGTYVLNRNEEFVFAEVNDYKESITLLNLPPLAK